MSDIKRLVSAATAQWLPVALGALAVPSGARHQRKSPQSQGPSACVYVCVVNVITGLSTVGTAMKGTPLGSHKSSFLLLLSGF